MLDQIEKYKEIIKKAELENAKCEGQLENIQKQLKEQYDINTIEQAKKEINDLKNESIKLKIEINNKLLELEKFEWEN